MECNHYCHKLGTQHCVDCKPQEKTKTMQTYEIIGNFGKHLQFVEAETEEEALEQANFYTTPVVALEVKRQEQ